MSVRRVAFLTSVVAVLVASVAFALGAYSVERMAERRDQERDAKLNALRAEIARTLFVMNRGQLGGTTGTSGVNGRDAAALPRDANGRAAIVEEIKKELQSEMGLVPVRLLRDRRDSFVEMYTYDNYGGSSYGTAGYLGNGYFITVKHGVIALGKDSEEGREPRRIVSIKLMHGKKPLKAVVVDAGEAEVEVDPGDWAILKVRERVDLPALNIDLSYQFHFADPIFRLGNDYSKGIILATGYVGQKTQNKLVTCLTDGHPGVSGGGVLDQKGDLVGIPIGRMQGDFRFSFILPLRSDMFRKVPALQGEPVVTD